MFLHRNQLITKTGNQEVMEIGEMILFSLFRLFEIFQGIPDRHGDIPPAVTSESLVDLLKTSDPIGDFFARVGTSRSLTKMSAASEGAPLVDHATRGVRVKERAGSVITLRELFAPR